jgi:hypothetical protein
MSPKWGSTPRFTEWLIVSRNVTLILILKRVSRQSAGGWTRCLIFLIFIVSSRYLASNSEKIDYSMFSVVVVYRVEITEMVIVSWNYELKPFNKSIFQSKPRIYSLTRENIKWKRRFRKMNLERIMYTKQCFLCLIERGRDLLIMYSFVAAVITQYVFSIAS